MSNQLPLPQAADAINAALFASGGDIAATVEEAAATSAEDGEAAATSNKRRCTGELLA
jgi:hypothetical protein